MGHLLGVECHGPCQPPTAAGRVARQA